VFLGVAAYSTERPEPEAIASSSERIDDIEARPNDVNLSAEILEQIVKDNMFGCRTHEAVLDASLQDCAEALAEQELLG
jgi:hypothetical protein